MRIEIHVAISYVMSQLYEKLPRRRVNIFGEELERALKEKFEGHWYPEAPEKGSGYRCLKVGRVIDPPDPLLEKAAYDSGLDVQDILEHLPKELNVWIDPGEVSFRIGDKGATELLYSAEQLAENSDNEVARTFNPEAKCFRPNDGFASPPTGGSASAVAAAAAAAAAAVAANSSVAATSAAAAAAVVAAANTFNPLAVAKPGSPAAGGDSLSPVNGLKTCCSPPQPMKQMSGGGGGGGGGGYKNGKAVTPNSMHVFVPRTNTPTFTTATFAQTKFGSTKLKTNSKRTNRMSPTEFANYIKQRAQIQQQMQLQQHGQPSNSTAMSGPTAASRSFGDSAFYGVAGGGGGAGAAAVAGAGVSGPLQNHYQFRNGSVDSSAYSSAVDSASRFATFADDLSSSPFFNQSVGPLSPLPGASTPNATSAIASPTTAANPPNTVKAQQDKHFLENFNFALNSPGPSSPYQHLLLAN